MNLATCQYLIRIAEHGSLSNAAVVLGVTQSALSRAIREMEAELGVPIFHRDGRGVTLTEDGKVVLAAARTVSDTLNDLRSDIETLRGAAARKITVGMMPSTARLLTVPLMAKLREDFPGTQMQIAEGSSGHLAEWLNDGRLDLAVTNNSSALKRFNPEPVLTHNLHIVTAKGAEKLPATVKFSDLGKYPLVVQSRNHSTRRELDNMASEQGVKLNVVVEADSLTAINQLVAAGLACALLPHFAVDLSVMQSAMVTEPEIERIICLVSPLVGVRAQGLNPLIRSFRSEIRSVYKRFSENRVAL